MLTCKQVSKALEKQDYHDLPWYKKLGLKLHVSLCVVCRRYNGQVMIMQDTCREFRQRSKEEDDCHCCNAHLEKEKKDELQALVESEMNKR